MEEQKVPEWISPLETHLNTPSEMKAQLSALRDVSSLPEENEIIITSDGQVLLDVRNPIDIVGFGRQVGAEILCG